MLLSCGPVCLTGALFRFFIRVSCLAGNLFLDSLWPDWKIFHASCLIHKCLKANLQKFSLFEVLCCLSFNLWSFLGLRIHDIIDFSIILMQFCFFTIWHPHKYTPPSYKHLWLNQHIFECTYFHLYSSFEDFFNYVVLCLKYAWNPHDRLISACIAFKSVCRLFDASFYEFFCYLFPVKSCLSTDRWKKFSFFLPGKIRTVS